MKKRYSLIFICLFTATTLPAQKLVPDKSVRIDRKKVEQCRKEVNLINSLPLRCDTFIHRPVGEQNAVHRFTGLYFDEAGRLRKYFQEQILHDGAGDCNEVSAYYDKKGELVYIDYESSNNCEYQRDKYFVHKGTILDFDCIMDCGCCEDDYVPEDPNRPEVGNKLTRTVNWGTPLTPFTHTGNLLKALHDDNAFGGYPF